MSIKARPLADWSDDAIRTGLKNARDNLSRAQPGSQDAFAAQRIIYHLEHERDRRTRARAAA